MAGKTKLDELVERAADLLVELSELDSDRKLSYQGFLKMALTIAECDEKRIAVVKKLVYEKPGTEAIQVFVRRVSKLFSQAVYTQPFLDPGRPARIYGSEELAGQLGQHQITVGEVQALCVMVAFQRFGEMAFGPVENQEHHERRSAMIRETLHGLYEKMKDAVSGLDLDTTTGGLFQDEIARGLSRTTFKRLPSLSPNHGDWPRELVAAVANAPRKQKRERERLRRMKAA